MASRVPPRQLAFALPHAESLGRDDFLEGPANSAGLALVDSWPDWPNRVMLLTGPEGHRVRCVVLTITNNANGGQPVSLANVQHTRQLCDAHGVRLLLDASRFAENAFLITARDPDHAQRGPRAVARDVFEQADGCWASLKKDGLANIGGLIAVRDPDLARRCRSRLIETEGYPTYGGLAGRDLDALAQGLIEVTDPNYLRYRAEVTAWFADELERTRVR